MMNATSQLTTATAEVSRRSRVPLREDEPATLVEMFLEAAREHHKPDALNYKRDGAWAAISSEEMIERTRLIALGLYSLGVRHGDRIGLLSQNCPEWTLGDAGALFAGAVDVPIYPTQTPSQVCYILKDSGARILFIQNHAAFERVREAIQECNALEHVVYFDADGVEENRAIALSEVEARGRELLKEQPGLITELERNAKPDDLATIIYTSGTTGEPKGVMLTHSNLVSNLIDSSGHLSFSEEDIALSVLPLSHVLERLAMYMYIYHGMSIYYAESLEKVGENFREVRPTVFIGVP
ncbi:MAG TPA: AMP-binding protein, partial [Pyrinomonadaceae bacterium]|nr:AMP-binding protein [Pyrinomonadaceae bacterium]